MKLKTFESVNISTRTVYTVYSNWKEHVCVERFTVDYLQDTHEELSKAVLKRNTYNDAVVRCIDVRCGEQHVSIEIK